MDILEREPESMKSKIDTLDLKNTLSERQIPLNGIREYRIRELKRQVNRK